MRRILFAKSRPGHGIYTRPIKPLLMLLVILLAPGYLISQISLRGATSATTTSSTLTISKPSGLAIGDFMMTCVNQGNNNFNSMDNASSPGWTLITSSAYVNSGSNRHHVTLLYKVATAADVSAGSFAFSLNGSSEDGAGGIAAFSGVDVGNPFDVIPGTFNVVNADDLSATSITTATANAAIVMFGAVADDRTMSQWGATNPSSLTELFEESFNTSNADMAIGAAWGIRSTAGSTGAGFAELSANENDLNASILIALRRFTGTITTGSISSPLCVGNPVSIPYTVTGTYAAGNQFHAELSNSSGSFASPTVIGSVTSTSSGSISAAIPVFQAAGTQYRVRVVSTLSQTTGSQTPSAITIRAAAVSNAGTLVTTCANSGAVNITAGASAVNASSVEWTSSGTGSFTNASSLSLAAYTPSAADISTGNVTLTLSAFGESPCGTDTSSKTLVINPIPVTTDTVICQGGTGFLNATANCPVAAAVNSGATDAGTGSNATGTGSAAWVNPGNITSAGSPYATASTSLSASSNYLVGSNYNFSIPEGSVIIGIEATIDRRSSGSLTYDNQVRIVKNGSLVGDDKAIGFPTAWPTSFAIATYGGAADLWGTTWTAEDINASDFGIVVAALSLAGRTVTVNVIRVNVTYMPPGSINWYTASSGGSPIGSGASFSPVGVAGSGLPDTLTPGTTTFYAECSTIAGCRTPANFTINALPAVSFSGLATDYCEGSAAVALSGNFGSGSFSGAGITDNGDGTAIFSPVVAGIGTHTVSYTYTDGNSCANTFSQQVNILPNVTYYADADEDGFGDPLVTSLACFGPPAGYVSDNTDCNDANASMHTSFQFYPDLDGDGFGSGTTELVCAENANTPPAGYSLNDTDCNDSESSINAAFDFFVDADGDGIGSSTLASVCAAAADSPPPGYSLSATDCDDSDANIVSEYPFYLDADGDGYGTGSLMDVCAVDADTPPAGYSLSGTDCDDALAAVNPGHSEVLYNGVDDNCDGNLDEGFQLLSQVLPAQCGTTLTTISSVIGAVSFGASINGYRFRIVNTETLQEQIIDRTAPHFQLTSLASYDYATTYSISVQLQRNGIWLGYYGPGCLVSTPAVLASNGAAQVSASQCGITLPSLSTLIATTSLNGVTGYRFRVTNTTNPLAPNPVQVLDRTLNWFSLTMLAEYTYGTTYMVEVAVKTNGVYSGYGSPCMVSTLPVPGIAQCDMTIGSQGSLISTASLNRATSYRFEVIDMTTFQITVIDRTQNWFNFHSIASFTPAGSMTVRVAVMTSGVWSDFGEACFITAPGTARNIKGQQDEMPQVVFRALGYPNPYSESFAVDVDLPSEEAVSVRIYDMMGKLVETKTFAAPEIEIQQFGERLSAGVYNVIVSQRENTRILRMIKR